MKILRLITLTAVALSCLLHYAVAQSISIDLNTEHQRIAGFGGMNHPYWIRDLAPNLVDKTFGNKPGQLGLSILRTYLHENSSQWDRVIPTAVAARDHGAIILASPWTPPLHMKSNNNAVGGELLPEYYEAYADHLLDFASFMAENEVPLYAISIINEPDIDVSYQSLRWSAQQMIVFLKEQGHKFDSINLIAAESFNFNHNITNPILNDPEAEQHVDIVGGHIYGGGLVDYPLAREKGKEVWMTEYLMDSGIPNSANSWPLALNFANTIHRCLSDANFNSFIWWYIQRFYSLIDDAGNITKRGYAMSNYSNFIDRGSIRVDAVSESLPRVDVSAYRTDSSLTVVVINRNAESVGISFSIEGNIIDSLTQLTTSQTKNVRNDGIHRVTGGTFQATVDGSSVTTFTSLTNRGEPYGNLPPVAVAGNNLDFIDEEGEGRVTVILDGTESSDPDGEIVSYSWSKDGEHIALTPTHEVELRYGRHVFVLAVEDNYGARDLDTLTITFSTEGSSHIWIEAECGEVGANWNIHADASVSNQEYVMMNPDTDEFLDSPSNRAADHIVFTFSITEAGYYTIWGRVYAPTYNNDSFWVRMDDGPWARWNGIRAGGDDWHWNDAHDDSEGEQDGIQYYLTRGTHTLTIAHREDGTGLDKIYITNTGLQPEGLGEPADSCVPDETVAPSISNDDKLRIYPNPASKGIQIDSDIPFTSVTILTIDGRVMLQKQLGEALNKFYLPVNLKPGLYLLRVSREQGDTVRRVLIQ